MLGLKLNHVSKMEPRKLMLLRFCCNKKVQQRPQSSFKLQRKGHPTGSGTKSETATHHDKIALLPKVRTGTKWSAAKAVQEVEASRQIKEVIGATQTELERLRSEDTPRHLMITHTIESCWIPSQNKVEWPWRYRSMSKVITCNTPSHASNHLYQI